MQLCEPIGQCRRPGLQDVARLDLVQPAQGMARKGCDPDFADAIFKQICGFGDYGFPESHAYSCSLRLGLVSTLLQAVAERLTRARRIHGAGHRPTPPAI